LQASKQASIRVGREIIGGGELATNLEVKLQVVFFFRGSLKCFSRNMELRNILESEKKPQQPLLPSSLLLLLLFFNFTRTSPVDLRLQSNKSSKNFVFGENPNSPFNSRI
jgi:hypothetical protein